MMLTVTANPVGVQALHGEAGLGALMWPVYTFTADSGVWSSGPMFWLCLCMVWGLRWCWPALLKLELCIGWVGQ